MQVSRNLPLQMRAYAIHLLLGPPVRDSAESETIPMCLQQEAIIQVERVAFLEDGVARTSLLLALPSSRRVLVAVACIPTPMELTLGPGP